MTHYNQTEIIRGLKTGDKHTFRKLFDGYYEPLTRFCLYIIPEQDEAEEIVQDVFVTLWEKRKYLEISISLNAYLYRMVKNRALNFKNHRKVRKNYKDQVLAISDHNDFADRITEGELFAMYEMALVNMPDRRREVFELSRKQGLKYAEIAEKLSVSVKTVEAHLSKALEDLREQLKDYLPVILALTFLIS